MVLNLLEKELLNPAVLRAACTRVLQQRARPKSDPQVRRAQLASRRDVLDAEIARLTDALAGRRGRGAAAAAIKAREIERTAIDRELAHAGPVITLDHLTRLLDATLLDWQGVLRQHKCASASDGAHAVAWSNCVVEAPRRTALLPNARHYIARSHTS